MTKWRLDMGQIEMVDEDLAVVLRRKTPAERLAMMFSANRTVRHILESTIAENHPDWSRKQVLQEVARRILGAE